MEKLNCQQLQNLLLDFIDKKLDQQTTESAKEHLGSCKQCHLELEQTLVLLEDMNRIGDVAPPASLRENFLKNLEQAKTEAGQTPVRSIQQSNRKVWLYNPFSQVAAGLAILIGGVLLGFILNNKPVANDNMVELQGQVQEMKSMLFMAKLDQSSASQRIQAVNFANEIVRPDNKVIDALINTMNYDDNTNVRMASIHALSKFSNDPTVRDAMVESLKNQDDALLQVTLINILVEIQEKKAIEVMRELLQKEETIEAVKDMAEKGLTTFI